MLLSVDGDLQNIIDKLIESHDKRATIIGLELVLVRTRILNFVNKNLNMNDSKDCSITCCSEPIRGKRKKRPLAK